MESHGSLLLRRVHSLDGTDQPVFPMFSCSLIAHSLFGGKRRESTFNLIATNGVLVARVTKQFAWTAQEYIIELALPHEGSSRVGTVAQEYEVWKRSFRVIDSAADERFPNGHVYGVPTERYLHVALGGEHMGVIQRNDLSGSVELRLRPGSLHAYRANRMRCLLVCAAFVANQCYWEPPGLMGGAGILKAGLPAV
mmetsp:Transcript_45864/g.99360  ORF Transcript_45864/g.99360 Transcript_45864/m.99360 type:complete len:196 (+) Transcript_45864:292-879(+)